MKPLLKYKFLLIFTCIFCSELSFAESDNEEGDSSEIEIYSEALRSYDGGRYMISKTFFEKLIQNYPGSPLATGAELKIADCLFHADRYAEAIASYREFVRIHNKHEARPYALFQIGLSFQKSYQGTKQDQTPLKEAVKQYVALVNEYPSSSYAKKAGTQILEAEEELLKAEITVIEFYERTDDDSAALKRKKDLKKLFGHLPLYKKLYSKEETEVEIDDQVVSAEPTEVVSSSTPLRTPTPTPFIIKEEIVKIEPSVVPSPVPSIQELPKQIELPPAQKELVKVEPTVEATLELPISPSHTPSTQASNVIKQNLKTLADLERKEKATLNELAKLDAEDSAPKSTFLLNNSCEYEMGVLKILLNFSSKPFLKSSLTDESGIQATSTVIFQEGFSTDALPAESNDSQWIKRPSIKCISTDDKSVLLQERIKVVKSSNDFGPKSYLFIYLKSIKPMKISIINSAKPESVAVIAQD